MGERIRVAVVFGGRSGEHSISCISAAGVLANLSPDRFDVTAIGITQQGRWLRVDPSSVTLPGGRWPAAVGDRRGGRGGPGRSGRRGGAERSRRGRLAAASRSSSPCCTVRTGRTARSRACSSSPVSRTSERACWRRLPRWTRSSPRSCSPPRVCRSAGGSCCGPGSTTSTSTSGRGWGCRCSSSRRGPARRSGSAASTRGPTSRDAVALARRTDPKVLVEAAVVGREIECAVLEYPDGRVEASPPAEISVGGDHAVLRLRRQVPRRRRDVRHPGRPAGDRDRPRIQELSRLAFRGAGRAGPRPRGLLRPARRRGGHQRGQHPAGLHPDLDVPDGCGRPAACRTRSCSETLIRTAHRPRYRPALIPSFLPPPPPPRAPSPRAPSPRAPSCARINFLRRGRRSTLWDGCDGSEHLHPRDRHGAEGSRVVARTNVDVLGLV